MKVSIIIPAYNVGAYVRECLDSILRQTIQKECEIIVIDDGSTDATLTILNEYKTKFENFILILQENMGSGIARNKGIESATGEFLAFIDADDFYPDSSVLENMYEKAKRNNSQICGGSAIFFRDGMYIKTGLRKGLTFSYEGYINSNTYPCFMGYWRFIYSRQFILNNNIRFKEYKRVQDVPFFLEAIGISKRIYVLPQFTYCYRKSHKQVVYTEAIALDYAKGHRDMIALSRKYNLTAIYNSVKDEINDELAAVIYKYVAIGSKEMTLILDEINENLNEEDQLISSKDVSAYVQTIPQKEDEFCSRLDKFKHIYIYGAGLIGKRMHGYLEKRNIKTEAFVVSNSGENAQYADGLHIYSLDDIMGHIEDSVIIVAAFSYNRDSIVAYLDEKRVKNYYVASMVDFNLFCDEITH